MSGSPTEIEVIETPSYMVDSSPSPPPQSPTTSDPGSPRLTTGSPTLTSLRPPREQLRRFSSCKDPDLSPTSDSEFPVK